MMQQRLKEADVARIVADCDVENGPSFMKVFTVALLVFGLMWGLASIYYFPGVVKRDNEKFAAEPASRSGRIDSVAEKLHR